MRRLPANLPASVPRVVTASSTFMLSAGQIGLGAAELLVVSPWLAGQSYSLNARVVLSVVALGAFGTGLAYIAYYGLIRDVGATTAATVTYFTPFVAIALGVLIRGEPLRWTYVAGAVALIVGVMLAEGRPPFVQPPRRLGRRVAATRGSPATPG